MSDFSAELRGATYSPDPVSLTVSRAPVPYPEAMAAMDRAVAELIEGTGAERLWFLEHPPLYTAGTSAKPEDLRDPARFDVFKTPRGGQYTYHGPGQRVAYVMLDLDQRGRDIRGFVRGLERWIIGALAEFGIEGEVKDGRVGVWVTRKGPGWSREDKIAAIGVKVRKWVSFHGISLNVEPDLDHFGGIVPCGIREHGVTSLHDLGVLASMDEVDAALKSSFEREFGSTVAG